MENKKLISVVVPMFNESEMADCFFEKLNTYLCGVSQEKKHISFEIIAVNDGSSDDTLQKLLLQKEKIANLAVLSLTRNFGQEPAVFAGLEKAQGDAVIVMDCDFQDPPEFIPFMVEKWEQGFEVVNARRVTRKSDTKFKRDTAGIYYNLLNRLSDKVRFPHNVNNFRLISRKVLNIILAMPEKNKFYRGLVPFTGIKSTEIDIEREKRHCGKSKYNFKAMTKLAVDGITATTVKPLSWAFATGGIFSSLGFLGGVALLILFLCGIATNYTLFGIIAAICFFSGIILLFTGIAGIYLGKCFEEIKGRPFNIVDFYIPAKNENTDINNNDKTDNPN